MHLFFATTKKIKPKSVFKKGYSSNSSKNARVDLRECFDEKLGAYNNSHNYIILHKDKRMAIDSIVTLNEGLSSKNKAFVGVKKSPGMVKRFFNKLKNLFCSKKQKAPIVAKKISKKTKKEKYFLYSVHTYNALSLYQIATKELERKDNFATYTEFLIKLISDPASKETFLTQNPIQAHKIHSSCLFKLYYKDNSSIECVKIKDYKNKNFKTDQILDTQNTCSSTNITNTSSFLLIFSQNGQSLDISTTEGGAKTGAEAKKDEPTKKSKPKAQKQNKKTSKEESVKKTTNKPPREK